MTMEGNSNNTAGLIERIKGILMSPAAEWDKIDAEPDTIGNIYSRYVFPLAAIPAVAGFIGSTMFGISALGFTYRPSIGSAATTAILQYAGALIGVYVLALVINALAPTFEATANRTQAFKVAAYSATASWVAGIFNLIPALSVIGMLLGLYSLYLVYLGLPKLMRAPEGKAVGYVVAAVVTMIVLVFAISLIISMIVSPFAQGL
jgi:hypothetical protein